MVGGQTKTIQVEPRCIPGNNELICTLNMPKKNDGLVCTPKGEKKVVCKDGEAQGENNKHLVCDIKSDDYWECAKREETLNGLYTVNEDSFVTGDGKGKEFESERAYLCNGQYSSALSVEGTYFEDAEEMQCIRDGFLAKNIGLSKLDFYLNASSNVLGAFCINVNNIDRNDKIFEHFDLVEKCIDKGRDKDKERIDVFREFIYGKTPREDPNAAEKIWDGFLIGTGFALGGFLVGGVFAFKKIVRYLKNGKDDNDKKGPPAPPIGGDGKEPVAVDNPRPIQPMERFQVEEEKYSEPDNTGDEILELARQPYDHFAFVRDIGVATLLIGTALYEGAAPVATALANGAGGFFVIIGDPNCLSGDCPDPT
ncbi:MAG: hypothetical protein ABH871_00250 [Pseudomonadota bacterium]